MSRWRLLIRSLLFHRRIHGSVALGVAAAAAVLTGSLLVGASMRGSLRDLTLQRLGDVDEVLTTQRFFDEANVLATLGSQRAKVAGLIWLPGSTAETAGSSAVRRSADIQVIGADERLWEFWPSQPRPMRLPETGEALINQALADDLGINSAAVMAGEEALITLRPPRFESVSSDSPLGEKEDLTYALPRLRVIEVLPNLGAGRFGLHPTQLVPRTAWVGVAELQRVYEVEQGVNSLWVGDSLSHDAPSSSETDQLNQSLRPTFADYGLLLKRAQRSFPAAADVDAGDDAFAEISSSTIFDWWYLSSDRMVIDEAMADDLMPILSPLGAVPVMTYLANDIGRFSAEGAAPDGKQGVPFSMVSAVDFDASFAPLSAVTGEPIGPLQENEIVLNEWAANDLGVVTGDLIRLTYFLPETAHGKTEESFVDLKLKDIAALTTPSRAASRRRPAEYDQPPTLINDPDLTPEVPGVTDQESIENWDLPFPTADRNREQDDEYWEQHRTTPKAFVNYSLGAKLWGSRFGSVTSFRLPASTISKTELESQVLAALHQSSNRHGFEFRSVKRDGLQSAAGTTPFDGLFLGLSLFVIVAALLLVVLLYRLGLERRLPEIGTLMAIGFSRKSVAQVLVAEGGIVASGGAALGVLIGIAYAALMVFGLQTWWVGAVRTPFLTLHVSPTALVIGFTASLLVCGATIAWTVFRFRPGAVRGLLAGRIEEEPKDSRRSSRGFFMVPLALLSIALLAAIGATQLGGEAQAGAFLGAGAAILAACLTTLRGWLRREASASTLGGLVSLAQRNGARNPTRSTLTIGLVAAATFLIGGISAFRLSPTERGVGGFDLVASTSRPDLCRFE
jgi:putative ABC transport system permease protein